MSNKQTAVEWLFDQLDNELELYNSQWLKIEKIIEQAKELEKQQIIDAFENGEDNIDSDGCSIDRNGAKQYYNETFKKK